MTPTGVLLIPFLERSPNVPGTGRHISPDQSHHLDPLVHVWESKEHQGAHLQVCNSNLDKVSFLMIQLKKMYVMFVI